MAVSAYFITGTDTDVGKTIVTAGLSALSCHSGLKTAVMKPVQTGTKDYLPDLDTVRKLSPFILRLPQEQAMPYMFPLAASPHLAAAEAGVSIDIGLIKQRIRDIISSPTLDVLLIEGAGGVLVPINHEYTFLDLMKELNFPVIIVAKTGLGTINHTLLSLEVMKRAGLEIHGIIFNKMPLNPAIIDRDNIITIEKMGGVPILGIINEIEFNDDEEKNQAALLSEFRKNIKSPFRQ